MNTNFCPTASEALAELRQHFADADHVRSVDDWNGAGAVHHFKAGNVEFVRFGITWIARMALPSDAGADTVSRYAACPMEAVRKLVDALTTALAAAREASNGGAR